MNLITDSYDPAETAIPVGKAVTSIFAKASFIGYAKHDNGSLYISNGHYIMKTSQADFDGLLEQVNKRKKTETVAAVEKPELLKYVDGGKGKFELSEQPLEFESGSGLFISLFADDKQYFGYNKKYVDIFGNGDNKLFVDDNATYDTTAHCLIVKSRADEVIGAVLALKLPDEIYTELADVLPLKIKWKNEYERIKENPTNDPYIGKEFFDGKDNYIISAIKEINGADVYVVPNVKDGKISGYADYIKVDDIEDQIARWETKRVDREKDDAPPPAEKETTPVKDEPKPPARPFTHLKNSPWGEVAASEKLCPGVFIVSAAKQGGIMVERDMTAALSPAAVKCGVKYNDFLCFEDNGAKDVAFRELLDKKLWAVPGEDKGKAAFEEKINKSLRERQPGYWRSRENRRVPAPPMKAAPAHDR
jgi:hypothetical protein